MIRVWEMSEPKHKYKEGTKLRCVNPGDSIAADFFIRDKIYTVQHDGSSYYFPEIEGDLKGGWIQSFVENPKHFIPVKINWKEVLNR